MVVQRASSLVLLWEHKGRFVENISVKVGWDSRDQPCLTFSEHFWVRFPVCYVTDGTSGPLHMLFRFTQASVHLSPHQKGLPWTPRPHSPPIFTLGPLPWFSFFFTALISTVCFYIYLFICCCSSTECKPRESASSTVTSLKLNTCLRTWKGLSKCMLSECLNAFTFMKTLGWRYCYLRHVGEGTQSQMTWDNYSRS